MLLNGNEVTWRELEKRYDTNNLPNWLVKQEFVEEINDTIKEIGCFIQTSRRETFSYAIGEMSYAGLDVIASDIEGTKWAKELPTVHFFESENVEELYKILKGYLENKEKFKGTPEKQIETRKIIDEKYSINLWANKLLQIYNDI